MLPLKNRLSKQNDFTAVKKGGKSAGSRNLAVKALKNRTGRLRLGVVVSTKVSKSAVKRNLIKRRVKAGIIEAFADDLSSAYDVVVFTRPSIIKADYKQIRGELKYLLVKLKLKQS